jgi:hypothetical protein
MKRIIVFSYLLFALFSIIVIEKMFLFSVLALILFFPVKKMLSKMSYEELETLFFITFFRNKFPNHPLFR